MTADRFWPTTTGEFTALRSLRPTAWEPDVVDAGVPDDAGEGGARSGPVPDGSDVTPADGAGVRRRGWRPAIPPQHGAWAFLIVPVLMAFAITGASAAGWVFLGAWVSAYPVGYFGGRALAARARRGTWSRLARREAGRAIPWAALTALLGIPLALTRPWLLPAAAGLAVLWAAGLVVAGRRGERSLANDLLLVAQAAAALPLAAAVVAGPAAVLGPLARDTLVATLLVCAYLTGSVLHVKALIREAGNPAFHRLDVAWHVAVLAGAVLVDPWWILGFGPALARSVAMRAGLRPGVIGGVEAAVAVLVVVAAVCALPGS